MTVRTRSFGTIAASLVAAALILPTTASTEPAATAARSKPNIVFIITDDQRSDQLTHMPIVRRRLMGKGVHFTNAFVSDPLCCPSRTTILTGKYSHSTKIYRNRPPNGGLAESLSRAALPQGMGATSPASTS